MCTNKLEGTQGWEEVGRETPSWVEAAVYCGWQMWSRAGAGERAFAEGGADPVRQLPAKEHFTLTKND